MGVAWIMKVNLVLGVGAVTLAIKKEIATRETERES